MIGGDWESTQVNSFQPLDPAENRKSLFGRLSFEVSDGLNLFVQASYAKSKNLGNLGIQLNQGNVTIQSDNAFLPQSVRDELALQGIDEFKLGTTNANLPVRKTDTRRALQRYVVGANGEIDLSGSRASVEVYQTKGLRRTAELERNTNKNAP